MSNNLKISILHWHDIILLSKAFSEKPRSIFEQYFREQSLQRRIAWVAFYDDEIAGYTTLVWESNYKFFKDNCIPEIMDLNVIPKFRKRGIGKILLKIAENKAIERSNVIGLGVGLYGGEDGGYSAAQRLYIKSGYIPTGNGVTYNYIDAIPGNVYRLDDDLILWLTKTL